ncbi:MAG: thymidine phosphorylase [Eubacterium sp.]|nr:thymidine phosphorylase [Eubacterium sp.]
MNMNELIIKKRNGGVLSEEEIRFIVDGYTDGSIPDYQMSSFLMATWFKGMNDEETTILTLAMAKSGDMLDLSDIFDDKKRIIDKHSTGGVGDKTTLIIGPILAALGVPVAKMSGRGLGHTGGTIDKLESIPGFSSDLSEEEFTEQVRTVGFSDMCQTKNLAPADKKIYALRDVTGTVDNYSLIASSVMSKKLAAGADGIVLDVKCGSGAFMKDIDSAKKLAEIMVNIGKNAGRDVTAVISDMNEPLGRFVGNTLEVLEALNVLRGGGDERLKELSVKLAAEMLRLAEKTAASDEAVMKDYIARIEEVIDNGAALAKFREFVAAQGGDTGFIDGTSELASARLMIPVKALKAGVLTGCDTEKIGTACLTLGGGREKLTDEIDPSVGIEINKHLGDSIDKGGLLAIIYANDEKKAEAAKKLILEAYSIEEGDAYHPEKLIKEIIR